MVIPIPSQKDLKEMTNGERIYPGYIYRHTKVDHETRYRFAEKYITKTDRVLDAACGCGYGTAMLADKGAEVTGVDISEHAIGFASKNFKRGSTNFIIADLTKKMSFPDGTFDKVVSFETLEHLLEQEALLGEFKRILKPGGLLVISTPDKTLVQKANPDNKYHLRELTKDEFVQELSQFFKVETLFGKSPYKELSLRQKLTKIAVKIFITLDFLHLRRRLIPASIKAPIVDSMNPTSEEEEGKIHQLDIRASNYPYVDLIAVCRKQYDPSA